MRQAEFEEHVGVKNICPNVEAALDRARECYEVEADIAGAGIWVS